MDAQGTVQIISIHWRRACHLTTADFSVKADVYYGEQTLHQFLERSVAHFTHHTRQLQAVVQKLGLPTTDGLRREDLAGLPLPEDVYDDKVKIV